MRLFKILLAIILPATAWSADNLTREVNHELTMLPYYGVFDFLGYKVDGREVTLVGQVRQPKLKSDAEKAVRGIEGIETVDNKIEVLPNSPSDDQIRLNAYRALYSQNALQRYQLQAVPPIHILVKNGDLTLEGIVTNQLDKTVAGTTASSLAGVHKVTNNLKVETAQ